MNFFDKFFLKLFLYTSPLLQKLEIDIDQLKAILVAKLTMDNRRPAAFQQMRQSKEKKEINSATLKTMFVSLIMGLFFLMGFAIGDDMITKLEKAITDLEADIATAQDKGDAKKVASLQENLESRKSFLEMARATASDFS